MMCVIVDNSARNEVFGKTATATGRKLEGSFDNQKTRLVLGGGLRKELMQNKRFRIWFVEADRKGSVHRACDACVNDQTTQLNISQVCQSNDTHVIALAQISGCKILCAVDRALQVDFTSTNLINGRVLPINRPWRSTHNQLMSWTRNCAGDACQNQPPPPCPHHP